MQTEINTNPNPVANYLCAKTVIDIYTAKLAADDFSVKQKYLIYAGVLFIYLFF